MSTIARVEFPPPADLTIDSNGNVLVGRSVTAKLAGTATNVTHYSALTGGTSTTGGLFTHTDGTIVNGSGNRRYVDSGTTMDITIAGRSRQVEALSASVETRVTAVEPAVLSFALKSAVVGDNPGVSNTGNDHTAAVQTFINNVSATMQALTINGVAEIDVPPLHYRVQNLTLPGNVRLVGHGRFTYVHSSQNPPTGPGNYVIRCYGRYGGIRRLSIAGNGAGQTGIGGVWLMPAGAANPTSERSYQTTVEDISCDQFEGRAVYDQGVGNHVQVRIAQNSLLGATAIGHFMGVVEQAGTDGWLTDTEASASQTATSGGIQVPRCPTQYNATALSTTNGSTSLPLSGGVVTLVSAASASVNGGAVLIAGHLITYTGVSGVTLTGATCADTATIPTGTSAYPVVGFVAGIAIGGSNNWAERCVGEFADVGLYLGNSLKAHATGGVTLTTSGVGTNPVVVDNACHLPAGGTTVGIPTITSTVLTYPQFTYTSISEATLAAGVTLTTSGQSIQVDSTAGWPASGTFSANGRIVTYTSIVDGTHIGGCTIASGTATLATGTYLRANTLNGCSVSAGTLVIVSGQAITEVSGATKMKLSAVRGDFSRTHAVVMSNGGGQLNQCVALSGSATATNTYDGWHVVAGSLCAFDSLLPVSDCSVSPGGNRYRAGIQDLGNSGSNFCRWLFPRDILSFTVWSTGNTTGGWFNLAKGPGALLTANSATPSVRDLSDAVTNNSGATTVTNFTNGVNGQELTLLQDVNTTIANNANIVTKSGANITPPGAGYAALRFKKIGVGTTPTPAWYQL